MKQKVTIDDVARRAGVSKQTVSRAINDKGDISPKTRARILALVKEMGYRPNRMAQAMNTSRSHMIGLVVPDITNPFFPELVRAVQDAAMENGYTTLICNTDNSSEIEVLDELVSHGIDGLITFTHQADDEAVAEFADRFGPMLIINREFSHPNVTTLMVDNVAGGCLAVSHLVAHQHTRIGMLTTDLASTSQTRRVLGYKKGLELAGIEFDPSLMAAQKPTLEGGLQAARELLARRPDVTALFTYNDLMGVGAIRACKDIDLRVPEDVSIIGFDGINLGSMISPALSTIHVDKYEMGRLAFERIYNLIQEPRSNRAMIGMKPLLIERESTGPIPIS